MGVAHGMGTMSISLVHSREHAEKQEALKEHSRSTASKAGNSAVDAAFEAFMSQLLGTILQTGQQAIDAAKQAAPANTTTTIPANTVTTMPANTTTTMPANTTTTLPANTATAIQSAPVTELPDRAVVQKAEASAPSLLGLQAPVETSDAGKAVAAFSDAVKAVAEQEDQPKPSSKTTTHEKSVEPDNSGLPTRAFEEAQSKLYGAVKTDYRLMSSQREGEADTTGTGNDAGAPQQDSAAPAPLKTDFAGLMAQTQAGARLQEGHAASQGGANAAGSQGPLHSRVHEPMEFIDNTVSIVKDGSRLAVKLEPEGLGRLDINISLDKGMVNTQIQVSDAATKTLIENNMQQLVHSLVNEGLAVGGFSVAMEGDRTWDGAAKAREESSRDRSGSAAPVIEAASRSAAQGMVSIFV